MNIEICLFKMKHTAQARRYNCQSSLWTDQVQSLPLIRYVWWVLLCQNFEAMTSSFEFQLWNSIPSFSNSNLSYCQLMSVTIIPKSDQLQEIISVNVVDSGSLLCRTKASSSSSHYFDFSFGLFIPEIWVPGDSTQILHNRNGGKIGSPQMLHLLLFILAML